MAAPAATLSALSPAIRRRYNDKFIGKIEWSYGKLAALAKKIGWSGFPTWAMQVGNSPATSADFATAQSQAGNEYTQVVQPVIPTYQTDFGVATLEGRLIKAAGSGGSLFDKMVVQVDGIMKGTMHSFSTKIYGAGWGKLSKIHSTTTLASTTLKLEYPEDAVLFEKGMLIQFSESESGHVFRGSPTGESLRVEGIDFKAGTITTSANVSTIDNVAVGDCIFKKGDREDSATPTRRCIVGLEGQFNASDTIFGYTRSNDSRLRGVAFDASGMSVEEMIIEGLTETDRLDGNVDKVFVNPTHMKSLVKSAQGRYRQTMLNGPYGVGVKGISVVMPTGREIDVIADKYCPVNRIFGLEMDSLQVFCADNAKIPAFLDDDGMTMLRLASADGVETRVGYYAEVGSNAPCHNFVARLSSSDVSAL